MLAMQHHAVVTRIRMLQGQQKEQENLYITMVLEHSALRRMVASWSRLYVHSEFPYSEALDEKFEAPEELPDAMLIPWLWSHYHIDYEAWLLAAGLPPATAYRRQAEQLAQRGCILPDGSMHPTLVKAVNTLTIRALGGGAALVKKKKEEG